MSATNKEERVKLKLEQLSGVHSRYLRVSKAIDEAIGIGMLDIDGEFLTAFWGFSSHMMKQDGLDWLEWYIYDNDNGADGGLVEWEGGSTHIRSLSDLATMLVELEIDTESN